MASLIRLMRFLLVDLVSQAGLAEEVNRCSVRQLHGYVKIVKNEEASQESHGRL